MGPAVKRGVGRSFASPVYATVLVFGLLGLAGAGMFLSTRSMPPYLAARTDRAVASVTHQAALGPQADLRGDTRFELISHAAVFTCINPIAHGYQMASATSSIVCHSGPLVVGSLRGGSTAAQARAEAEASGYEIPPNYVAQPATNAQGWVFRAPGTTGNANTVRVGEADAKNPTGYVRYFNAGAQPLNAEGNPGPNSETHLPLRPDQSGVGEDPTGDDFFDLGYASPLGRIYS
jgi:hypothetical protein